MPLVIRVSRSDRDGVAGIKWHSRCRVEDDTFHLAARVYLPFESDPKTLRLRVSTLLALRRAGDTTSDVCGTCWTVGSAYGFPVPCFLDAPFAA